MPPPADDVIAYNATPRRPVQASNMFTIKLELAGYRERHPTSAAFDMSQGDGGLSLGGIPRAELARALERFLPERNATCYGDPTGREDVRAAVAGYHGLDCTPDCIFTGDGGRDVLQKWYQAIQLDASCVGPAIIGSAAPWGSYIHGAYLNHALLLRAPGEPDQGFRITAAGIDEAVAHCRRLGRPPLALILTSPDNPTGRYQSAAELVMLTEHAVAAGVQYVLLDLIYQLVVDDDIGRYDIPALLSALSPATRERVCILDGLTKSAGASNVRHAHLVVGSPRLGTLLRGIATHTVLPGALGEAAALEVYGAPDPTAHPWVRAVVEPTSASRAILRQRLTELGHRFIADQGYYAFVDIGRWLGAEIPQELRWSTATNIDDVSTLKSYLTSQWGLAVIPGTFFKQPRWVRLSYANEPEQTRAGVERFQQGLDALVR